MIFSVIADEGSNLIFSYEASIRRLTKGLWLPKTPELFMREGIEIDLLIHGSKPMGWRASMAKHNYLGSAWNIFHSLRP